MEESVTRVRRGLSYPMEQRAHTRFREVYEAVFPIIIRVVYRITNDLESAEEICQEAFIRYYTRMDQFPDADQAKYWLIRVSKNLALNSAKRSGRERRAYDRVGHEPKRVPTEGEQHVLREESQQQVLEALELLPEKLKTVLVMKEYGGLSYRDIAKSLGISEGNVKVRVFRARQRLASLLKEDDVYVP